MVCLVGAYHLGKCIRILLRQRDEVSMLFHEVLSTTLTYRDRKEEKEKKKLFNLRVEEVIKKLNYNIRTINNWKNKEFSFLQEDNLIQIDLASIKHIIDRHEGRSSRLPTLADLTSSTFTVESFSKKNTLLKLQNTLVPFSNSASEFEKNLEKIYAVFGGRSYKFKARSKVKKYLDEARDVYSFGHFGTASFLVGKALEASITDYLLLLKANSKIKITLKDIEELDFEAKINRLRNFLTPSQCAKMLSVKWDRNVLGHASRRIELLRAQKDADAIIRIGINLIEPIESKLLKLRKNRN